MVSPDILVEEERLRKQQAVSKTRQLLDTARSVVAATTQAGRTIGRVARLLPRRMPVAPVPVTTLQRQAYAVPAEQVQFVRLGQGIQEQYGAQKYPQEVPFGQGAITEARGPTEMFRARWFTFLGRQGITSEALDTATPEQRQQVADAFGREEAARRAAETQAREMNPWLQPRRGGIDILGALEPAVAATVGRVPGVRAVGAAIERFGAERAAPVARERIIAPVLQAPADYQQGIVEPAAATLWRVISKPPTEGGLLRATLLDDPETMAEYAALPGWQKVILQVAADPANVLPGVGIGPEGFARLTAVLGRAIKPEAFAAARTAVKQLVRRRGAAAAVEKAPTLVPEAALGRAVKREAFAAAETAAERVPAARAERFVLTNDIDAPGRLVEREREVTDRLFDRKTPRAERVRLAREWGEIRGQQAIHRELARVDIDEFTQLDNLQAEGQARGEASMIRRGRPFREEGEGTTVARAGATPLNRAKIEQLAQDAEGNAITRFVQEARSVPASEVPPTERLLPTRAAPWERRGGEAPFEEEVRQQQAALEGMPSPERRPPPEFGAALRQPEGLNPPPLEVRSPTAAPGGLFEEPGTADWQAAIDARESAPLPPIAGGAMPATYEWRGVAPSVLRPTKGLWAAVTNTVRAARGLPRLSTADFLGQAQARASVANYGKGIEEASRVSQQAVNDYRKMVPKPPRLKAAPGNDAPKGLVGTELDIMERPQAYKGGQELALPREWWQEYGRMDLADLEERGISVNAYEDYVFQHRYGDYFRRLGLTDTSGASASLRTRMLMQKQRRFPTGYDAWKASEGGVAVAADKDGVLHTKFLAKDSSVKVGDSVQVGTRKAFGKEYPVMGRVERIGPPLLPDVTDPEALIAGRFEQSALLRAQKDLFDSVRDSAFNTARKGVPQGYKTLSNLPGPLADLKLLVGDGTGATRLVSVRKLAWPSKTADTLQGLLAPERLPAAAQTLTNAVAVLRDLRLNLDPSMVTLIFSRYPLGHPITFLRNAREFGAVMRSPSAWRGWVAEDPMVRRFIDGGGGGLFQRMEYLPGEAKPLVERFARIPGTPISLQAANEETMRVIGYGTVKTAQLNEQLLRAVRAGMKLLGADNLNIPLTRIARMTDQEILEASVKSAMDQFGKLRYNDLGMSQWGKAAWRNSILTPGFLKTHISLLLNSPKAFLGNPEGILGLVFLTQYAGIMLGIAEGLSRVSGFHTSADPRNVNFGAIRTPFGTFSAMGQVRTYMRLFANVPGDLHAGYYDRLYRSGLSRLGIVPNELAMQIRGEEYFGEPMGGPAQRLLSAGVRSLPIGFQTPVEIAMGKEGAIDPVLSSFADWTGASFWPRRTLDLLDEEIRKPVSEGGYGIGWWDAEPWQRQEIEERHPELQGRAAAEQKIAARRGLQSAQYRERFEQVTAPYDQQLEAFARDPTLSDNEFRLRYNDIQAKRRAAIDTVDTDPRFADYIARRGERAADTLAEAQRLRGAGKPLETKHILAEYGAVFDRHRDETDPQAPGGLYEDLDFFWGGLSPSDQDKLNRNLGLKLPERARQYQRDSRQLKNYWAQSDLIWVLMQENYPELAQYPDAKSYERSVQQRLDAQYGLGVKSAGQTRGLSIYNTALSRQRERYRRQNPSIDAILVRWYGRKAKTAEAVALATQAATAP